MPKFVIFCAYCTTADVAEAVVDVVEMFTVFYVSLISIISYVAFSMKLDLFLPHEAAMLARVLGIVILSVHLSVTRVLCDET